jgi:hypothetical protein
MFEIIRSTVYPTYDDWGYCFKRGRSVMRVGIWVKGLTNGERRMEKDFEEAGLF